MRVTHVLMGVVLTIGVTSAGDAQVVRRQAAVTNNGSRIMVANPYVFTSADSIQSVTAGDGMRSRVSKLAGTDYSVIERKQMNEALEQYAYPIDAILSPGVARTLAQAMSAKLLVTSSMTKVEGGRYTLVARISGLNDDAGNVVSATQETGQKLDETGGKAGELLGPAIKSYKDAKGCMDLRSMKPDDAVKSARDATKVLPTNGLANYCLALIAQDRKQPTDSVMKYLNEAQKGDPQSLPVLTALAVQYEQRGDSAKVISTFQQMLRVAPTNQKLREQAFKLFLNYGHADAALDVADEGLALDPTNADLWDLKSNACLFSGDYKCAVDALEQVFGNDSTKADSSFYTKITVAAGAQPDTVRLLKWAQRGAKKYPTNVPLLEQLMKAYGLSGQPDSVVAVANRILKEDPNDVNAALQGAKALVDNKRGKDAIPLLEMAIAKGDASDKENAAALLLQGAAPMLQEPQDLITAAQMLQLSVKTADPNGKVAAPANLLLGYADFFQVPKLDPEVEAQKSCDLARQEETLLNEAETAFTKGRSIKPEAADKFLGYIAQYKPRAAALVKAYCK